MGELNLTKHIRKNRMEEFAALFGLKLGDKFWVIDDLYPGTKYLERITEEGCDMLVYTTTDLKESWSKSDGLMHVLQGSAVIEPYFEPKLGEFYYSVYWDKTFRKSLEAVCYVWDSCTDDWNRLKLRNVFRTKEEAEQVKYDIYKCATGEEWKE